MNHRFFIIVLLAILLSTSIYAIETVPLPEHPRPDFQREHWINLNGEWAFKFDGEDAGVGAKWFNSSKSFSQKILVPFPWGSPLSGVEDESQIAWYQRQIKVPNCGEGMRIFLIIGASDWETTCWFDSHKIGSHRGGYTPIEFELTNYVKYGKKQNLVIRVDDVDRAFKLEGKQGYGNARGIWQTVYLEARPSLYLDYVHFTPDIDKDKVSVRAVLDQKVPNDVSVVVKFKSEDHNPAEVVRKIKKGKSETRFDISIPETKLWSLEDPYLYEVSVMLRNPSGEDDSLSTYFGMRKISVMNLPGTDIPYIALNNKPIYLETTLDQSYHPEGFYTFPSDAFMRDEILRTRRIGLNGQRIHIKVEVPRKLYWADKLGVLIMADVPNSWGEPDASMRSEIDYAMRAMIKRDYNHPSIFSWVLFNETWGLYSQQGDERIYTPETQKWVANMYESAKQLDASRLIEDNSVCCGRGHTKTDINSWHHYLPGWEWDAMLDQISRDTYPKSTWNFEEGYKQGKQPNFNSECGNVWGYDGSTGDVDWSWDYHRMIDAFRKHPAICGWLYTEHHDVINEWNGYYKYDRSNKITGLEDLGMSLNDLHNEMYLVIGDSLCGSGRPGQIVNVPLYASFLTDTDYGERLMVNVERVVWDQLGRETISSESELAIPYTPWYAGEIDQLQVTLPDEPCLALYRAILSDQTGTVLHRNLTAFVVQDGPAPRDDMIDSHTRCLRVAPNNYTDASWSLKKWDVLDGLKVNGAGHGYFEYTLNWPADLNAENVTEASFKIEVSAKQLNGKDRDDKKDADGDYMRGRGAHDRSLNPNAYPMTDEDLYPSAVRVRVNGESVSVFDLPDDPADHRGFLSWHSQLRDRKLREAGSYGYLVSAAIPMDVLQKAEKSGRLEIRLEVDESLPGGLAIYGEQFGRYPLDPTLVLILK
ncbi:glycoside hydrolase family 2 [candidate division KSB1 bacterium]|nr:glycoside hydrolase family 2 [candidate division KSB1 bacterium]